MIITIQTKPAMARDLTTGRPTLAESQQLESIVSQLGLHMRPLHPGTTDPELASRFYLTVPDQQAAENVRQQIENLGLVEAVYVKPPDALPF